MLDYKLGRIMDYKEIGESYCPLSLSNGYESRVLCRGIECPKWVRMADAAYFMTDEERKALVKIHPGKDEWWISHGFCSL